MKKILLSNENKLDKSAIEKIKQELEEEKKSLIEQIKSITGGSNKASQAAVKFPDFGNKDDENAQEIDQFSTNIATEKVLENALRDIDNALARIEKGTYGICKYCGKDIGKKRMLARPVASACVECKTKLQNG